MKLFLRLLCSSWKTVLLAGVVGAVCGAANVALVALIFAALRDSNGSSLWIVALFAALCATVLATRVGSQWVLCRMAQANIASLRIGLCRRILDSPLKHLEEIGIDRMLGCLTNDVDMVSHAINGVPVLVVNSVVLVCGAVYLGSISLPLLAGGVTFAVLGLTSYWYFSRWADVYANRTRQAQDAVLGRVRGLIEGVKELKMHHDRRRDYLEQVTQSQERVSRSKYLGDTLFDAAVAWGRLTFFIAIGLLLFLWPRIMKTDSATLTGYALVILYLMSPLEQILAWLPFLAWTMGCLKQIESLGLDLAKEPELLDERQESQESTLLANVHNWREIELTGVTHAYRREGKAGFLLGPIDVTIGRGQIVFIIGGNGSGKTTLAKLLSGLYVPESGQIRLDGQPVTEANRENYRQLFSVVFDDAMIFDSLWGLRAADVDQRAREYLSQLELSQVVTVTDGVFSTTKLSRGQRKRLALVTAYLEDRPIYLFDEWAADQDPIYRKIFYQRLLPELKSRGKTVLAITHDDRYFSVADQVVKLEEGKLVQTLRHEMELIKQ